MHGLSALICCGMSASWRLRLQVTTFGNDIYPMLHEKAAVLLHSLLQNHPFIDGACRPHSLGSYGTSPLPISANVIMISATIR